MIVVVEGISAAGKTTFSRKVAPEQCIPEFEPENPLPGPDNPIHDHAAFWVEHNVRRFTAAMEMEQRHGFALCDTDPFKCHFDWCRARAGFTTMDLFKCAVPMIKTPMADRRLGFADRYLVKHIAPDIARAQKEGDETRSRRRFGMHLALQPHLIDWYRALSPLLPGRVEFEWPEVERLQRDLQTKTPEDDPRRFDVGVFEALLERLPD